VTREFLVPLPPNPNRARRMHWAAKNKAKETYWDTLDMMLAVHQLPPRPASPWNHIEGTAEVRTLSTPMDQDNANARLKWVWDWLETRGYIQNDRTVRCTVTPALASSRRNRGITLTLKVA
jgi:hypothetical protein